MVPKNKITTEIFVSYIIIDKRICDWSLVQRLDDSFMTYQCDKSNTTGAISGAGNTYPSGAPEFTLSFKWD